MQRVDRGDKNLVCTIEVSAICDECNKRVQVVRIRFTKTGYVILGLECGHQTGFAFTEKLVPMEMKKTVSNGK